MAGQGNRIRKFADHFARVISDVVDTDVIITDADMNIVGSAFRYLSLYNDIHVGTLIAEVLTTNRSLLIRDKAEKQSCRQCEQFSTCKMKGFVGVPIHDGNRAIGVIALILTKAKVSALFRQTASTLSFMENMAEITALRMISEQETEKLKHRVTEIQSLMDTMSDAVLYTDRYGNIIYTNQPFRKIFHQGAEVLEGRNIKVLYPVFEKWYQAGKNFSSVKVSVPCRSGHTFYGIISGRKVYAEDAEYGWFFSLRSYREVRTSATALQQGSLVTFQWLAGFLNPELIERLQHTAMQNEHVLLQSGDNAINELIAKAMVNASQRRLEAVRVIYMQNVYRDLLDAYFLDEYGVISSMQKGSLIIVQPERMTLFVQDRLADVIRQNRGAGGNGISRHGVRFLFCTTENLQEMTAAGTFSAALWREIEGQAVGGIETIHDSYQVFMRFVLSGLRYYRKLYHAEKTEVTSELLAFMWKHYRSAPIGELETAVEHIVRDRLDYRQLGKNAPQRAEEILPLRDIEKENLKLLLDSGYSRKEIMESLGLSRTTLYRRLKAYGLDGLE